MHDAASKGDQARAEILAAARDLFVSSGFHGTSMRAIAQAAGNRAVAGLYNHFPTKEAIFEALIVEANPYEDLFGALDEALAQAQNGPEFVHIALRTILAVMPPHYSFFQLSQIDLREFEGRNVQHMLRHQVFPHVLDYFQRLSSLSGIKPVDPMVWIRTMASIVIGFITTEQLAPALIFGTMSRDEWADRLADVLLYGLASEPPSLPPSPEE